MKNFIFKYFIVLCLIVVGIFPVSVLAQTPVTLPFGGQILLTLPCTCTNNVLIINRPIGPTSVPFLIFDPKLSILFPFFELWTPGPYILGTYTGVEPCLVLTPIGCVPYHPKVLGGAKIDIVGTSLPGI